MRNKYLKLPLALLPPRWRIHFTVFFTFLIVPGGNINAQTNLCAGDSLTINLLSYTGIVQWVSSADGINYSPLPGQTGGSLIVLPLSETWYTAAISNGTCDTVYSDTTHIILNSVIADAGPDLFLVLGTADTIGGNPAATGGSPPYSYLWFPQDSLSNPTISNPVANPVDTTQYILFVTDSLGCADSDTMIIYTILAPLPGTDTFFYTGVNQTFSVPPGTTSLTIECWGAQGGNSTVNTPSPGGLGAKMIGTFSVTPGQVLNVVVGKKGNPDPSSGGGGGASGVGFGATPWIIAGGGAGIDFQDPNYLLRHATVNNNGNDGNANGGSGATAGADGGDWTHISNGDNISRGGRGWLAGNQGSTGQNGSTTNTTWTQGTFGLGGGGGSVGYGYCNCGGGGGGYSGGGSGNINQSGGGGGSYNTGTSQNNTGGIISGDGRVIFTW